MQIELNELLQEGKDSIGSTIADSFLLQLNGPADEPWRAEDGAVEISDFRLGFACLLSQLRVVRVVGQRHALRSGGEPVLVSLEDLEASIGVAGSRARHVFPAADPMPDGWRIELRDGPNHTVVDGDIVRPAPGFAGELSVPVTIAVGKDIRSNTFALKLTCEGNGAQVR